MTDIRVLDLVGPIGVVLEDGAKLCDQAHEALGRGETVCLDFSGITALAGPFLSAAIGRLYAYFSKDDLDRRLRWKGLDVTDDALMRLVQRNAVRFYAAEPPVRAALLASSAGRWKGDDSP